MKRTTYPALELLYVIRLADKYQADRILTDALHMVHPFWPKCLIDWDWWDDENRMRRVPLVRSRGPWLDDLLPEPISTILIAQRHDFAGILRAALYQLYRTPISCDRQERLANPSYVGGKHDLWYSYSACWSLLDKAELMQFTRAKEKIDKAAVKDASALFRPHIVENNHADTPYECWRACQAARNRYIDNFAYTKDVLFALRQIGHKEIMQNAFGMCKVCAAHIEEQVIQFRNKIWDTLPAYYGMD